MKNVISVDVEQWYHRQVLRNHVSGKDLDPSVITSSVRHILRVFKKHGKRTTFFLLGEVVEQAPELVEEILVDGHEVGFHGYSHVELNKVGLKGFEKEVRDWASLIRPITKERVRGFRASLFSLNKDTVWALDVLSNSGFTYDSSVFPVRTPLYGSSKAPIHPYRPSFDDPFLEDDDQRKILEMPILVRDLGLMRLPAGGGFYMRALGYNFVFDSIKALNKRGYPAMCYLHPWEVNGFPRVKLPFHKGLYAYHGVPCSDAFEKLVKMVDMAPACEVIREYEEKT